MKKKRLDGVRITGLDGFHAVAPYIMPKRTEAEVSSTETFDVTDLCAYLEKRNKEEGTKLKLFHAFCTAIARTIYLRPKMNIFISGKRYWQRNDITLTFDERIVDEFYYAKSLCIARFLLKNPEHLAETMETPVPVDLS